jgi:hypothetical protein
MPRAQYCPGSGRGRETGPHLWPALGGISAAFEHSPQGGSIGVAAGYAAGLALLFTLLSRVGAKQVRRAGPGRVAAGRPPIAVGGFAQILVASLAYLGPSCEAAGTNASRPGSN